MGMDSCPEDSSPTPEKGKNSSWDRTKIVWMDLDTQKWLSFKRERDLSAWVCHLVTVDMDDFCSEFFTDKERAISCLVLFVNAIYSFLDTTLAWFNIQINIDSFHSDI